MFERADFASTAKLLQGFFHHRVRGDEKKETLLKESCGPLTSMEGKGSVVLSPAFPKSGIFPNKIL